MVPFSGFFSKDEILTAVFDFNPNFGILMSFIAGLTAFYMFRLYYNIFWGTPSQYAHTPHEAPRSMTIPLMILAAITLFAGFIPFGHFVSSDGLVYHIHLDWSVAIPSIIIALIAIGIATFFYKSKCDIPDRLQHMPISIKQPITVFTSTSFTCLLPNESFSTVYPARSPGSTATSSTVP